MADNYEIINSSLFEHTVNGQVDNEILYKCVLTNKIFYSYNKYGDVVSQRSCFTEDNYGTCVYDIPLYPTGLFLHVVIICPNLGSWEYWVEAFTSGLIDFNLQIDLSNMKLYIRGWRKIGQLYWEEMPSSSNTFLQIVCILGSCVPKTYCLTAHNNSDYNQTIGYHDWNHVLDSSQRLPIILQTYSWHADLSKKWYYGNWKVAPLIESTKEQYTFDIKPAFHITAEESYDYIIFIDPKWWTFVTRTVTKNGQDITDLSHYPLYKQEDVIITDEISGTIQSLHSNWYNENSLTLEGTYSFLSPINKQYVTKNKNNNFFHGGFSYGYMSDVQTNQVGTISNGDLPTDSATNYFPWDIDLQGVIDLTQHSKVARYGIQQKGLETSRLNYSGWPTYNYWKEKNSDLIIKSETIGKQVLGSNVGCLPEDDIKGFTAFLDQFYLMCFDQIYFIPLDWTVEVALKQAEISSAVLLSPDDSWSWISNYAKPFHPTSATSAIDIDASQGIHQIFSLKGDNVYSSWEERTTQYRNTFRLSVINDQYSYDSYVDSKRIFPFLSTWFLRFKTLEIKGINALIPIGQNLMNSEEHEGLVTSETYKAKDIVYGPDYFDSSNKRTSSGGGELTIFWYFQGKTVGGGWTVYEGLEWLYFMIGLKTPGYRYKPSSWIIPKADNSGSAAANNKNHELVINNGNLLDYSDQTTILRSVADPYHTFQTSAYDTLSREITPTSEFAKTYYNAIPLCPWSHNDSSSLWGNRYFTTRYLESGEGLSIPETGFDAYLQFFDVETYNQTAYIIYTWPVQTTDESTPIDRPLMPTDLAVYEIEETPYEINWTTSSSQSIYWNTGVKYISTDRRAKFTTNTSWPQFEGTVSIEDGFYIVSGKLAYYGGGPTSGHLTAYFRVDRLKEE